jgi:phosphopentomutase
MRVFLTVIDSFGIGEMPDAHEFGDEGSNTYKNIYNQTKVDLVNLKKLGLNAIDGVDLPNLNTNLIGSYARLSEITKAKDTTAGHYELAGIVSEKPYPVFPNAFPKVFMVELEKACGVEFIGNEVASGTEIIERLGNRHLQTSKPIIYTSQDSVLQIAAHDSVVSLENLYEICKKARKIAKDEYNVARIIARPFTTIEGKFVRTANRKDFALDPPQPSMLDKLSAKDFDTISVGKVVDVFNGKGISKAVVAKNNSTGLIEIEKLIDQEDFNGLAFINLVDTDMLFGHRNDVEGYAQALKEIDNKIGEFLPKLKDDDVFLITADHGCDPSTPSTDHSREYVPLLIYSKKFKAGVNLGTIEGFNIVGISILDLFGVEPNQKSLFRKLKA